MAGNQGKGKGFFRQLLRGNSSRPTLLRGDPHERGVTGSARRARQEEAARHSIAQRSSALDLVRTPLDDQSSSIQSSWGVSSDDDNDADDVRYEAPDSRPLNWTVVRGPDGKFARGGPSFLLHPSTQDVVSSIMSRHGRAGPHNPLTRTG